MLAYDQYAARRNFFRALHLGELWIFRGTLDRVSKAFSDAVENLGRNWGDKNPPTFHEIRSLSERLYAEQGNINTQDLLGHKDPRTTQTYHDSRGDWVRVKVG